MARLPPPAAVALLVALAAGLGLWWLDAPRAGVSTPGLRQGAPESAGAGLAAPTLQGVARAQPARPVAAPETPPGAGATVADAPICSLRIDVVDGLTGRDLTASWNVGTGEVTAAPFFPDQVIDDEAIARSDAGVRESIRAWEAGFLASESVRLDVVRPEEGMVNLALTVRPPAGLVSLAPTARIDARIAAGVRALMAVVPLIDEAVLDLHVTGPDGRPAEGARLAVLNVGGVDWPCSAEDTATGVLRIRGIPHLAGEPVETAVEWNDPAQAPHSPAVEVTDGPTDLISEMERRDIRATIPESLATPWTLEHRLPGPTGPKGVGIWLCCDDGDWDFDSPSEDKNGPHGSLRLRLVGWDGRPVKEARIFGREANAEGEVVLANLRPGAVTYHLASPGRLPVPCQALIHADQQTAVTLHEPVGARLEVQVVEEDGHPRPSARLDILGATFFDVNGPTQRVDLFTDHLGRRTITRVEPGEAEIHASWGSRKGSEKVTLVDGETTHVRIVAR